MMLLKIRQAGGAGRGRTAAAPTLDINARGARHHGPQRIALCYVLVFMLYYVSTKCTVRVLTYIQCLCRSTRIRIVRNCTNIDKRVFAIH